MTLFLQCRHPKISMMDRTKRIQANLVSVCHKADDVISNILYKWLITHVMCTNIEKLCKDHLSVNLMM